MKISEVLRKSTRSPTEANASITYKISDYNNSVRIIDLVSHCITHLAPITSDCLVLPLEQKRHCPSWPSKQTHMVLQKPVHPSRVIIYCGI